MYILPKHPHNCQITQELQNPQNHTHTHTHTLQSPHKHSHLTKHTHTPTTYSHIPNKMTQASREGSNINKHEGRPPEDGQTIVTEKCRVLIDVFYEHF